MDPILLQKQVRDNADELNSFLNDLKNWEKDMKRKDQELLDSASDNMAVPPVRSKNKRKKKTDDSDKSPVIEEVKRIPSYDYSAWDKFDVEKACAEVDSEAKEPEKSDSETAEDPTNNDVAKLREQALFEKELGNQHVKEKKWNDAIECYSKAILCNPYDAIFYANRALCYLKTQQAKLAETDCTSALQLDSTYVKAYQRRALARIEIGLKDDAKADFEKVLEFEPNNSAAKSELMKLEKQGSIASKTRVKERKKIVERSKSTDQNISKDYTAFKEKPCSSSMVEEISVHKKRLGGAPDILGGGGDTEIVKSPCSLLREGDEDVVPVQKPPHLRSKTPLRVVPVQEVDVIADLSELNTKTQKALDDNLRPKIVEREMVIESLKATEQISLPTSTELKPDLKAAHVKETRLQDLNSSECQTLDCKADLPPVPKTSVQFFVSWKIVRNISKLRYQFLKQIPGNEFPQIFQESLESKEFSEIINTLAIEFLERNEPIYPYLRGLSEVRRFSALVMFMSKTEKAEIKKLLQYCDENHEGSKEDIAELMKHYEIK